MSNRLVIGLYLLMLVAHFARVFEKIWGNFFMVVHLGLLGFLVVNWFLFCLPVPFLYFVLGSKLWAYYLGIVYLIVMVVKGIGHNLGSLITGRYFGGFAGGFTGIGLILIGRPLIYFLRRTVPTT